MRPKTPHRFVVEDRGYETPCHVWTRALNSSGYALVRDGGKVRCAHVVIWEEANGPTPDGHELDHLCRVRSCVNESHLEPVTSAENSRRGAATRLTPADVAAIRAGREEGASNVELAARFGVTASWISRIISGRTANRRGSAKAWA